MRNLKECQAEVFRRSEKRIEKRRKTYKRIGVWCIPLVLCIAAYSAVSLLPGSSSKGTNETADGKTQEFANGSYICSYERVEIRERGGKVTQITDKVAVTKAFSAVFAYDDKTDNGENQSAVGQVLEADVLITFSTGEGDKTVCGLHGNRLIYGHKNIQVDLTDAQVAEMLTALGIEERSGV